MSARFLPHPILTAILAVVWVLLVNDFSWGALTFGLLLGVFIAKLTSAYWPERPKIGDPLAIIGYAGIVLYDILISNVLVAYLVLFRRGESLRSHFIVVPLDVKSPEAIAMLAGTITMTPGTVSADLSADLSADNRSLLVHCLDVADTNEAVATIKSRYERRLMRIFG